MGLISFIKDAGEKLFSHPAAAPASAATGATPAPCPAAPAQSESDLDRKAGDAIRNYIEAQKLGIDALAVTFDGGSGKVTLTGNAPTQAAAEKAALAAGNVQAVTQVDNRLAVAAAGGESQYHDVQKGDTLSAIAKHCYGDAGKYPQIFEANRPMLSDPNRIYPGQKLRIPPLK